MTLQQGTILERSGSPAGQFLSPKGTPLAARSLPPGAETRPLTTYKVIKPFEVMGGRVAPWYNKPGLGTAFDVGVPETPNRTIQDLIDSGHLIQIK